MAVDVAGMTAMPSLRSCLSSPSRRPRQPEPASSCPGPSQRRRGRPATCGDRSGRDKGHALVHARVTRYPISRFEIFLSICLRSSRPKAIHVVSVTNPPQIQADRPQSVKIDGRIEGHSILLPISQCYSMEVITATE